MKIKYLSDKNIIKLATNSGRLGLVTTYKDLNLSGGFKVNNLRPIAGGVYDKSIFGSMKVSTPNVNNMKFGCIKLPIKYCLDVRKPSLIKLIKSSGLFLVEGYLGSHTEIVPLTKFYKVSELKDALDYLQFNVVDDKIVATPNITDSTKCSYEGIILALTELGKTDLVADIEEHLNSYIIVTPIVTRKFSVTTVGGELTPNNDPLTQSYRYLLYGIEKYREALGTPEYNSDTEESNAKHVLLDYKLRKLADSINTTNPLLMGGHDNFSRKMQRNRISGSARAVIVPGSELQIDEVGVPLHLAYEMMDKEFIEYMMENFNISRPVARARYNKPYEGNTLKIFSHYIDGTKPEKDDDGNIPEDFNKINWIKDENGPKHVIINRQPTLHQLSMLSCRVKLTKDNAIKYPILLCGPLNADFDGDTISLIAVPKYKSEIVNRSMNPKNLIYYTKNNSPLFTPNHEMMLGLIVMTKAPTEDTVLSFDTVESMVSELKKDFNKRPDKRTIRFNTKVSIDDNINTTTVGRALLSTLFDNDPLFIETMLNDSETPRTQLDPNLVSNLVINLSKFMEGEYYEGASREVRIKDIQYWSLMAATKSGSTAPSLSQLYLGVSKEMLDRIKEVEDDDLLDQTTKSVRVANIYKEYIDRKQAKGLSKELIRQVSESSRAKESQLVEMTSPQLIVDPNGNTHVTSTTYVQGVSYDNYMRLVESGRGVQDIKHTATPTSGYLTRQMIYSCYNWKLNTAMEDPNNKGLLIPEKLAVGRTLLDGSIYKGGSNDKKIRVRSLVTSSLPRFLVTPDMLNKKYHNYPNNYSIGTSFASSLTEGITQSALGLKHGGVLLDYDPDTYLVAPEDCELSSIDDDFIVLTSSTRRYVYPTPRMFSLLSAASKFKKGENIGVIPVQFTPGLKCDAIIRFMGATGGHVDKAYLKNRVVVSDCYCCEEGIIKYETKEVVKSGKRISTKIVKIGNKTYQYNSNSLYHFADGDHVKVGDRICSGIGSMSFVLRNTDDSDLAYGIFYDQISRLVPGISTELLEFLFSVIFTDSGSKLVVRSVADVLAKDGGTFQRHARQSPKRLIEGIDFKEGEEFILDDMSSLFLNSLINRYN